MIINCYSPLGFHQWGDNGCESAGDSVSYSPSIRIVRGPECRDDPCAALHELAGQNYGPLSALPVSLLRNWYEKTRSIFRIALTSEKLIVGYLSALPLFANVFENTLDSDFQETSIKADDIDKSSGTANRGVFISSIVVAPDYQKQSPASLLLRLAFIEDLIGDCLEKNQAVRISAQALSPKGAACMRSLGLKARDCTAAGWKVYYGRLGRADLLGVREELQQKLVARF
jgi:ribosomal protein S18 acetylase RimI-like enzyme